MGRRGERRGRERGREREWKKRRGNEEGRVEEMGGKIIKWKRGGSGEEAKEVGYRKLKCIND